ncbi:hypothetical protein K3Z84_00765 [Pseudomonas aeruginosa]|nr:hypothetical protein [Pseudomonas aeruginosa]
MSALFKPRNNDIAANEVAETKEEFIKGAAVVHRESSVTKDSVKKSPVDRMSKLLADLESIEAEMALLWEESGKTPKTIIESFTKLPNVDKKLEIMYEDARSSYSSKSKFISSIIEEKFEEWRKAKGLDKK